MHRILNETLISYSQMDMSPFINEIIKHGTKTFKPKGETFYSQPNDITFFVAGSLILKKIDSDDDDNVYLGTLDKYYPIGLMEHYYPHFMFRYETQSDVELLSLSIDDFMKYVMANEEARQIAMRIVLHIGAMLVDVFYERSAGTGFTTINAMLNRYIALEDTGKVNHEGIAIFIQKRTRLSKSYIFQVLSDLRKGGYITVKKGKLISIDRKIPDKY